MKSQPSIAFNLPNQDGDETSRIRFTGQLEEFTFSFALWDNGEDRSDGTGNGTTDGATTFTTIVTLSQQIQYLMGIIYDKTFDTDWFLQDNTGRFFTGLKNVFVESLSINNAAAQTGIVTGQITLSVGTILTLASLFE